MSGDNYDQEKEAYINPLQSDEDDMSDEVLQDLKHQDEEVYDYIVHRKSEQQVKKSTSIPEKRFFCLEFIRQSRSQYEYYLDPNDLILRATQKYRNINYIEIRQHKLNFNAYYVFVQQTRRSMLVMNFEKFIHKHYGGAWKIEECDVDNMYAADPESSIIAVHGHYRHKHNHSSRPSASVVSISHHKSLRYEKGEKKHEKDIVSKLKMDILSEMKQFVKDIVPAPMIVNNINNDNSTNMTLNDNSTNVYNVVIKNDLSINMYGNEDTYHIKPEDWKEMIESTPELSEMICKALEKVRENPDNKNFIMKNRNDNHVGIKRFNDYEKIAFDSFSSDALTKYVEMIQHDSNMGNHIRSIIRNVKRRQGKESVNPVHRKLRDIAVKNYKDTAVI